MVYKPKYIVVKLNQMINEMKSLKEILFGREKRKEGVGERRGILMKSAKSKALRKKRFEKDEKEGIHEYKKAINESKGRERRTYKSILPEEKEHLSKIKKI